jgi:hypothetical protein
MNTAYATVPRAFAKGEDGDFGSAIRDAMEEVTAALGAEWEEFPAPMFRDAAAMLKRAAVPSPWLIRDLITRGGIATIGGEPKTCKTWLATEIAIAVATGTLACGTFKARAGVAAYFYAEDGASQVRKRIRALIDGTSARILSTGRLHVSPAGPQFDLMRDHDLAWVVASCKRLGSVALLVLDPLRNLSSAAEDKSDDMSKVMRRLRVLGQLLNCTVAIVHHTSKSSADSSRRRPGQRLRGSGAIHGATDSGIYLSELKGNGSTFFRNVVDSEIKGARSAGRFTLELRIEDDVRGEATSAEWIVARTTETDVAAERAASDDDAVLNFVRARQSREDEAPLSRTELRKRVDGVPDHRARAATERLLALGKLVIGDVEHGNHRLRNRITAR